MTTTPPAAPCHDRCRITDRCECGSDEIRRTDPSMAFCRTADYRIYYTGPTQAIKDIVCDCARCKRDREVVAEVLAESEPAVVCDCGRDDLDRCWCNPPSEPAVKMAWSEVLARYPHFPTAEHFTSEVMAAAADAVSGIHQHVGAGSDCGPELRQSIDTAIYALRDVYDTALDTRPGG